MISMYYQRIKSVALQASGTDPHKFVPISRIEKIYLEYIKICIYEKTTH